MCHLSSRKSSKLFHPRTAGTLYLAPSTAFPAGGNSRMLVQCRWASIFETALKSCPVGTIIGGGSIYVLWRLHEYSECFYNSFDCSISKFIQLYVLRDIDHPTSSPATWVMQKLVGRIHCTIVAHKQLLKRPPRYSGGQKCIPSVGADKDDAI